jgi:hypothetical protein
VKIKKNLLLFILTMAFFSYLSAETIEPGDWFQTSSTAGDAPDIVMSIIQVTPHIIQLDSNNGWVGFAWYSDREDEYTGFFELLKDTGNKMEGWTNKVFTIRMMKDNKTVTLYGENEIHDHFTATFRLRKKL